MGVENCDPSARRGRVDVSKTQNEEVSMRNEDGYSMRRIFLASFCILTSALCLSLPGCNLLGLGAQLAPPPMVDAQYKGMAGQSVGVMVWADRGVRIDWSPIRMDLANSIQVLLSPKKPSKEGKPPKEIKEFKGATFPVLPKSIVRYQDDHPEIEGEPITDVAPRLTVTRLIYVEIEDFATRAPGAVDLYRGSASATLKIVEVDPQTKTAKVAYEENGITAEFPRNAPEDGVAGAGDQKMYVGTIKALAEEIVKRLVPYQAEEW